MSRRLPAIGELLDRVLDLAILDPEARSATRVVTGHAIDALTHQLGHQHAGRPSA